MAPGADESSAYDHADVFGLAADAPPAATPVPAPAPTVVPPTTTEVSVARSRVKVTRLKAGQRRTVKLRVKLTRKARVTTPVKVTAKAGSLRAKSSLVLRIGKAKKIAPGDKKGPLVGTYWWRTVDHAEYAWDNRAFYFVDDRTVYSGLPTRRPGR